MLIFGMDVKKKDVSWKIKEKKINTEISDSPREFKRVKNRNAEHSYRTENKMHK